MDAFCAGLAIGFGVFCVVVGCGSAFKVVSWVGRKLDVPQYDV